MICKILSFFFSPSNRNFFSENEKLESYAIKGQSHPAICARYTPLVLKVARYSFSKSIPPKFERKLRRHKQDERRNFVMIRVAMTSELSWQRNDAITYFTCSSISRHWELFFQNRLLELFPTIVATMFVKFKRNL